MKTGTATAKSAASLGAKLTAILSASPTASVPRVGVSVKGVASA
jgi:hypothetical protein